MITAVRPQTVSEVTPATDSWQPSWSAWRFSDEQRSGQGRPRRQQQLPALASGCTNLRTLLSIESLGEVWGDMLGQRTAQDGVINSWTELLRLN